jgi:hypothetical protein
MAEELGSSPSTEHEACSVCGGATAKTKTGQECVNCGAQTIPESQKRKDEKIKWTLDFMQNSDT